MEDQDYIIASLPMLNWHHWDDTFIAILEITSRYVTVVSVGKTLQEAREKAYRDISNRKNETDKQRMYGEILYMGMGDELVLRRNIRVCAAYCDARTYYTTLKLPPKSVYVAYELGYDEPHVKFVKVKDSVLNGRRDYQCP